MPHADGAEPLPSDVSQSIAEHTADALFVHDTSGRCLYVNQAACQILGYSRDEFLARRISEIDVGITAGEHAKRLGALAARRDVTVTTALRAKDGREIPAEMRLTPIELEGQRGSLAVARPRATTHPDDLEIRYRHDLVLQSSGVGIWIWDPGRDEVAWEGYPHPCFGAREVGPRTGTRAEYLAAVHPDDRVHVAEKLQLGPASGADFAVQYRVVLPDGRTRWIVDRGRIQRTADGAVSRMTGVCSDITERVKAESARRLAEDSRVELEQQLRQAHKMESIGLLAAGIAHDFNNLLTPVLGHLHLVADALSEDSKEYRDAVAALRAVERAGSLTQQLLALGRRQVLEMRTVDLNEEIIQTQQMLRRAIPENIEIHTALTDGLWKVTADPTQMQQILLNFAVNARDAMPDGGTLRFETENVTVEPADVARHKVQRSGRHVRVTVADDGCGMDAETLERVFEPFFTRKERSRGTGLGLATVYGIVKQHQGGIDVTSEPGRGARFAVYLLATDAEPAPRPARAPRVPARGGNETVLVVEDEAAVRAFVTQVLEGRGYRVRVADSVAQATARAEAWGEPLRLLLTDLVLPDGEGTALYQQIRALHPQVGVLFMSGYSAEGHAIGDHAFVQKPFPPDTLAATVRAVLDRSGQRTK